MYDQKSYNKSQMKSKFEFIMEPLRGDSFNKDTNQLKLHLIKVRGFPERGIMIIGRPRLQNRAIMYTFEITVVGG